MSQLAKSLWNRHQKPKNVKTVQDFKSTETPQRAKIGTPPKDPDAGSNAAIKTLYEGPESSGSYYNWVDTPPKQLPKSHAVAQGRMAIITYMIKDLSKPVISGRYSLKYHRIVIQNQLLMEAVADIIKEKNIEYYDRSKAASFDEPFRPLYYIFDDIVAKLEGLAKDDPLSPFLLLLVKALEGIFSPTWSSLSYLKSDDLITFELAWTLFPRGTIVLSWGECDRLCKVVDLIYSESGSDRSLQVTGEYLCFNGEKFVWDKMNLEIESFSGQKQITELKHYPLKYHKDAENLKKRCIARGKKALDYQAMSYCAYQGIALHKTGGAVQRHSVSKLAANLQSCLPELATKSGENR